ncbi:cell division protein SepF [Corynebacterium bovis]|uniref:cell division protein SepF n=1 Tax=Corynebacterium bovis TaxID=36808 RepID=UPI00244D5CAF|nr:cell division protein SepF [Corynebacterium bovis]MDH2455940.1 cell division protein SepF [Corynebacterium bovis]
MANGMNKFKEFFGLGDVDQYKDPYYGDEFGETPRHDHRDARDDYAEADPAPRRSSRYTDREAYPADDADRGYGRDRYSRYDRYDRYDRAEPAVDPVAVPAAAPARSTEPRVTSIALSGVHNTEELAVEARTGDIVVFNLAALEQGDARRVLDFSAGLAKGLGATVKKLAGVRNFVFIPAGVSLDQSQLDQLVES